MSDRKYSLSEAAVAFGAMLVGIPAMLVALTLVFLPIDLAWSYLRATAWNWFLVPYLHVPPMNMWLMFAISLIIRTMQRTDRALKDEVYKAALWKDMITGYLVEGYLFFLLFVIHHWILK